MKAKIICGIITIFLGYSLLQLAQNRNNASGTDQMASVEKREQIRDATLQIKMEIPSPDKKETDAVLRAKGLGSLVQCGGETLLVTHNHWGEFLQDTAVIELRDADDQLLKVMSGFEFYSLVRYQDAGTLVLLAPDGLEFQPAIAYLGDPSGLQAGEVVFLAYRQTPDLRNVAILEATVETVFTFQGLPTLTLRSTTGEPIKGGDSGGGVWHEGQLVGNLWATVEVEKNPIIAVLAGNSEKSNLEATNKSFAAIFPVITPSNLLIVESPNEVRSGASMGSPHKNTIGVE